MKTWFAFLFLVTLVGCQKAPSTDAVQHTLLPHHNITIAYTTQPQNTLVHVAMFQGYFAEEGLEAQSLVFTYGKASLQSLLEHKADVAAVAETPFMFSVLKGEKVFIIANVETSDKNNAIVARKDAGISAISDLRGKRIGFTPGTTSEFFLDSLLTANNLTRHEITAIPLKPEEMQEAIVDKTMDAVCTWNYPVTKIKHLLGENSVVFVDHDIYTETYNFAAYQDFVQKNPETVQAFLRALLKAEHFTILHREEAQSIVSTATRTEIGLVREVWNTFNYKVSLDQRLLIALEDETRWAIQNNLTDQHVIPDYRKFIHTDSLRAVKPEAVRSDW